MTHPISPAAIALRVGVASLRRSGPNIRQKQFSPESISLNRNELGKLAVTAVPLRKKQTVGISENARTGRFVGFLEHFVRFCRVFHCVSANCHENVTPILAFVLQNPPRTFSARFFIPLIPIREPERRNVR